MNPTTRPHPYVAYATGQGVAHLLEDSPNQQPEQLFAICGIRHKEGWKDVRERWELLGTICPKCLKGYERRLKRKGQKLPKCPQCIGGVDPSRKDGACQKCGGEGRLLYNYAMAYRHIEDVADVRGFWPKVRIYLARFAYTIRSWFRRG